jgi:hypothetical protein
MPRSGDLYPQRRGGDDTYSPLRGMLDFTSPLSMTAQEAGLRIRSKIEDVVAFIKETTGIDLSGITNLLDLIEQSTGLNLFDLGSLNPTETIPQLLAAFGEIDWTQPNALPEFIAAAAGALPVIGPILSAMIGQTLPSDLNLLESLPIVGEWGGRLLDVDSPLDSFQIFGNLPSELFGLLPLSSLRDFVPNLLTDPLFGNGTLLNGSGWDWSAAAPAGALGSAETAADGSDQDLLSNAITVDPGDVIPLGILTEWEGLAATGEPIRLAVSAFRTVISGGVASVEEVLEAAEDVDTIAAPGASSAGWQPLAGDYTVPDPADIGGKIIDQITMRLHVNETATAGTVRFSKGSITKQLADGVAPTAFIAGLPETLSDAAQRVQDFIDVGVQALLGGLDTGWFLDDWKFALTQIPGGNVLGAGGIDTIEQTFYTMWDTVASALRLDEYFGVNLSDLASAAQDTSFSALNANLLAGGHEVTLGVRTNNPIDGALERTTVANFNITQLGTAATPTNFTVDAAHSAIGTIRMPTADTKGILYWRSIFTGSVTGFYINFGKLNVDGSVTHLFQSPNKAGDLTSTWSWDAYQLPEANYIVHAHSENIVVEFIVIGAGNVSIAGQDFAWMTDSFPGATTKRLGASRNTGGGAPDLNLSIATMNAMFTTKTPWIGLGRADEVLNYHPPQVWQNTGAGAFTYPIPEWARVAGNLIDYFAWGGGGGGQTGGWGAATEGGSAGTLIKGTLVYGTDIPLGTTALTGIVGDNAAGGINAFILEPGDNGNATTINGPGGGGFATKTAAGGLGGGRSGNSWNQAGGQGAASGTVAGYQAFGGAQVGANQDGAQPGGGGGSGYPAVGRAGAEGRVIFRARQP